MALDGRCSHTCSPLTIDGSPFALLCGGGRMVGSGDDVRWEHFNDLHLISGTGLWSEKLVPSADVFPPRRGHSAWLFADRYLFVFGGLDHEKLFADLWAFDVVTREWTEVEQKGAAPSRRRAAISFQYSLQPSPTGEGGGDYAFLFGGEWYDEAEINSTCAYKFKFDPSNPLGPVTWIRCAVSHWRALSAERRGFKKTSGLFNMLIGCCSGLLCPKPGAPPRLYVFGGLKRGLDGSNSPNFDVLQFDFLYREADGRDRFQPSNLITAIVFERSTQLEAPLPRMFASAATLHNRIFIFGGHMDEFTSGPDPMDAAVNLADGQEWFVDDIAIFEGVDWARGGGFPSSATPLRARDEKEDGDGKFILWDKLVFPEKERDENGEMDIVQASGAYIEDHVTRVGGITGMRVEERIELSTKYMAMPSEDKMVWLNKAREDVLKWEALKVRPTLDRNGTSMVAVGDKLLVIGGGNYERREYYNDMIVIGSPRPAPISRHVRFEKGSRGGDLGSEVRIAWGAADLTLARGAGEVVEVTCAEAGKVQVARELLGKCGMFERKFNSGFGDADAGEARLEFGEEVVKACLGLLVEGSQPLPALLMAPLEEIEERVYECYAFLEFVDAPEEAWEKLENLLGGLLCAHAEKELARGGGGINGAAGVMERIAKEGGFKLLLSHACYFMASGDTETYRGLEEEAEEGEQEAGAACTYNAAKFAYSLL